MNKIDGNSVKVRIKLNSKCKVLRLNSKSKAKPNSQTSKAEADFTYLYANVTKDSGGTDIMKRIAMAGASFISPANI